MSELVVIDEDGCGDGCGCGPAPVAIACTLDAVDRPERVTEWSSLLSLSTQRRPIEGGMSVTFPPGPEMAARVADLAAREQSCCAFFDFRIGVTGTAIELEVRAPAEAAEVVAALFG